jgi:hypothetical protein
LGRSIKCFGSSEVRKQTLLDQFLQDWNSSIHNSPKAFNYRIFKTDFKFEEYFNILDEQNSLLLCKWVMVFCFVKKLFIGQHESLNIYIFFPEYDIRLYDKNSESNYYYFPPPKSEYFFQQHWESEDGVIFRGKIVIANFVKRIKLETNIITYLNVLI